MSYVNFSLTKQQNNHTHFIDFSQSVVTYFVSKKVEKKTKKKKRKSKLIRCLI